jgi:hypothetical protein
LRGAYRARTARTAWLAGRSGRVQNTDDRVALVLSSVPPSSR